MATTDDIKVNLSVTGIPVVDQGANSMSTLGKESEKTNKILEGWNVRNVANQIQDIAVQAELGTGWIRILGQQLPQLLGAFGTIGTAVGAVLAVGLASSIPVLTRMGVETRSLKEVSDALSNSIDNLVNSQRSSQQSLDVLIQKYGDLGKEAKTFFDLQQRTSQINLSSNLTAQLNSLMVDFDQYRGLVQDADQAQRRVFGFSVMGGLAADMRAIGQYWKQLNPAEADTLSKKLREIDQSSPQNVVKGLTDIVDYLTKATEGTSRWATVYKEVIQPIEKVNELYLKQKLDIDSNVKASAQFNAELMKQETIAGAGISEAKRKYDSIAAARIEGELRVSEFRKKIEKEIGDNENIRKAKESEFLAFKRKTDQETLDKIKDIKNAQDEAVISSTLGNDAKKRSLDLELILLSIQDKKAYNLSYEVQYEQELAKNRKEQADALINLSEQLRKNLITVDQTYILEEQIYSVRRKADEVTEKARDRRKAEAAKAQEQILLEGDARRRAVEYDMQALEIRQKMRQAYPEDIDSAVNIAKIKNDQFEAERKINTEMEFGRISRQDALERIAKTNDEMNRLLELERERTKEAQRYRTASFGEGATDAVSKIIRDNLTAYQKAGKMVEAVYANMGSAIDNFVDTGKFKFADFSRSVINDLIKIQLKADITSVLGAGLKFLGFNIPGRASGGPVFANSPYMVGENGPELFIPRTSGSIVPNGASMAGGGGTSITYNISAVDTNSFKQLIAKDPSFIYAVTEQGRKNIPQVRR